MDRRKNPRLEIQLFTRFAVARLHDQSFAGYTVNMSRSGVLIQTTETAPELTPGDVVQAEMELATIDGLHPRCLCCTGVVVRVSTGFGLLQFAISIQSMQFRNANFLRTIPAEEQLARLVM